MKTITRNKKVMVITLGESDSDEEAMREFDKLSNTVFDLTRGLYKYVDVDYGWVADPEFTDGQIFQQFDLHTPLQEREIDEVWVFGTDKSGTACGGAKSFWLGNPIVPGTDNIYRRFPVMRVGANPLYAFACRVESVMAYTYRQYPPIKNAWERFSRTAYSVTGVAGCGTPTYPPNGVTFGYNSPQTFLSNCDDWFWNYPEMKNRIKYMDSSEWGGTQDGFLRWWLKHLPHGVHKTDGIHDNWWHYVMNMDLIK